MKPIATLLFAVLCQSALATDSPENINSPKNIIMIVGDGMGPSYTTAYRMFADDPSTAEVEETVFDRLLVGMASTHPDMDTGYVTDSAAGATALSTGVKTYNGAIGVDANKKPVQTVLELAKMQGRKTGIAVTSQINHATPASFGAHNESRQNYNQIADSYFDAKTNGQFVLDVMLGGGWKYFIRDDRNLVAQFKAAGYQYVDKLTQLDTVKAGTPLLGLFADSGMPWALDSANQMRLPTLAKAAIRQLENDQGYFLLIEASQVDWAGHGNDIGSAMAEMHDLAVTLEWLEQYLVKNPDTLMVLTADHSTGGLSIGANNDYSWSPKWLKNLKVSPAMIGTQLITAKDRGALASDLLGFELSTDEVSSISAIESDKPRPFHNAISKILDNRSNTGWTTTGHTGVDVQIFAKGLGSERFRGHMDNTRIAQTVFELLKDNK
ncbi:alkaline phosphatase [Paraglaciecola sp. MB-3u-78]|uniref:alkaline phosphatase n=1 Tax=Paraglaciecola sp. MB-3u-78 TaxID=2058332 RepID=UPI000C33FCFC|nr:alkaline phosphatase [Paraglaciecola sp. MB-3u-78]PKG92968.1 alkaline phosphatase [Paraglaciecola sp. MB-3u-78]